MHLLVLDDGILADRFREGFVKGSFPTTATKPIQHFRQVALLGVVPVETARRVVRARGYERLQVVHREAVAIVKLDGVVRVHYHRNK